MGAASRRTWWAMIPTPISPSCASTARHRISPGSAIRGGCGSASSSSPSATRSAFNARLPRGSSAISAATVEFVAARLIRDGRVRRCYIGVAGQNVPLPRRVVRFHELERETGVRVQSTAPDGAARAAGLTSGDIIVAVDGIAVGDIDELHRLMTEERVGKPVPITVLRLLQKLEVAVTPRESPPRAAA